jgi:hypothetical protein
MAENGVRPPDPPPNGHRHDGQHNGHREAPIARQEDVFLDIPKLQVDKIELDVANLRARVSLNAEVLSLLKLNVGVDAAVDHVHLGIVGVDAEAQLKVRLENVAHIIDSVLGTLDAHPEIIKPLVENAGKAIGAAGVGIESAVTDTGRGAGQAVREIGGGTGQAVRDVGGGAGHAVRDVGGGAGEAVRDVGGGAGAATRDVGAGAGQVVDGAGQAAGGVVDGAGRAAGDVVDGAGRSTGEVVNGAGQATGGVVDGAGRSTGEVVDGAAPATRDVSANAGTATTGVGDSMGGVNDAVDDTDANDVGAQARKAGKQVTDHAVEAETEAGDEPDISAQSTVAADREEQRDNGSSPPRHTGLPRRKPRTW